MREKRSNRRSTTVALLPDSGTGLDFRLEEKITGIEIGEAKELNKIRTLGTLSPARST